MYRTRTPRHCVLCDGNTVCCAMATLLYNTLVGIYRGAHRPCRWQCPSSVSVSGTLFTASPLRFTLQAHLSLNHKYRVVIPKVILESQMPLCALTPAVYTCNYCFIECIIQAFLQISSITVSLQLFTIFIYNNISKTHYYYT